MMKRKGTDMRKTATITAISALLAVIPVVVPAQAANNPWNPYPATAGAQQPQFANPTLVQPVPNAALSQNQMPSRFAPQGLEQKLTASRQMQVAPPSQPSQTLAPVPGQALTQRPAQSAPLTSPVGNSAGAADYANPAGGYNVPGAQAYAPQGGYAPQGYAPQGYAPQGYANAPYGRAAQGYGGYPQAYGGYPQGYVNNGYNNGYGANTPYFPQGIPGGLGGFGPMPGNLTNGGVPGFNFSPFGFF